MIFSILEDCFNNAATSNFFTVVCDCFFIILETVTDILKIMACFVVQVALAVFNAITFGFGKLLLSTMYWVVWILFHFTCGILGLGDKSTSAFSWLFLVFIIFLYCDGSQHEWYIKFSRFMSACLKRRQQNLGYQNQNILYNEIVLENQRNEHREIEPINRQPEAENRENENEENNLVEADRHRIDNDNRRNVERENGVDNQRASIENRQNVERERHNTRTTLENRRNRTQEQQRYFLRQRNRNRYLQQDRLDVAQHGIGAMVLHGQRESVLEPNARVSAVARNTRNRGDGDLRNRLNGGEMEEVNFAVPGISGNGSVPHGRARQGVPHRDGGSMPWHVQLS